MAVRKTPEAISMEAEHLDWLIDTLTKLRAMTQDQKTWYGITSSTLDQRWDARLGYEIETRISFLLPKGFTLP